MKIGAMIFATDQTISIPKLAQELEARNFESLWIPEKTHLPASRYEGEYVSASTAPPGQ